MDFFLVILLFYVRLVTMGFDMNKDPRNLFAAVKKATDKKLNIDRFNDRLMVQKGCYILNRWGYGPTYKYGL